LRPVSIFAYLQYCELTMHGGWVRALTFLIGFILVDLARSFFPLLKTPQHMLYRSIGTAEGPESTGPNHSRSTEEKLNKLRQEISELEYFSQLYHAIVQRNEAQLGSFVDSEAQWRAQSQEDRDILSNHDEVVKRLEQLGDERRALSSNGYEL